MAARRPSPKSKKTSAKSSKASSKPTAASAKAFKIQKAAHKVVQPTKVDQATENAFKKAPEHANSGKEWSRWEIHKVFYLRNKNVPYKVISNIMQRSEVALRIKIHHEYRHLRAEQELEELRIRQERQEAEDRRAQASRDEDMSVALQLLALANNA